MRAQIIPIHSFKSRTHGVPVFFEPQIVSLSPEQTGPRPYSWRWLYLIPLLPLFFFLALCACTLQMRKNG